MYHLSPQPGKKHAIHEIITECLYKKEFLKNLEIKNVATYFKTQVER